MAGDDGGAQADLQGGGVDLDPAGHLVAQTFGRHRVRHPAPLEEWKLGVDPAVLHVGGVETAAGKRPQEATLDLDPLGGGDTGRRVNPGVHPPIHEPPGPPIQLGHAPRRPEGVALDEERFLQVPEGPFALPFAFGVAGLAHRDLQPVVAGEAQRRGVETEPAALGDAQRPHPVGAGGPGHTPSGLEEADQPLEGVLTVDALGEPPAPPA
jgi:hypothetical protein